MSDVITGGCACGAVRYEVQGPLLTARACWCRDCQYIGAGSGTVNVGFTSEGFAFTGEVSDYVSTADSGSIMHKRFCPKCGTHLFSQAESRTYAIFVRAGTLDDPNICEPVETIWVSEAPAYACFSDSIPTRDGQPPPIKAPATKSPTPQ